MNAIIAHPDFAPASPGGDDPGTRAGHDPVFSPRRQADFLASLQLGGNVRAACRVACVSAQTAYRARRASRALTLAWDAALVAARDRAEEVLANRAIDGVEEAVFYHGEEVARRRRYDSRLLLAHLARLDRMAERPGAAEALCALDDQIDALRAGTPLPEPEAAPGNDRQDPVPCVPSPPDGEEDEVIVMEHPDPPCRKCGNWCETEGIELDEEDCQYFFNRVERMDRLRPAHASLPSQMADAPECYAIEDRQLAACDADCPEWWLIRTDEDLANALAAIPPRTGEGDHTQHGGGARLPSSPQVPPPAGEGDHTQCGGGAPPQASAATETSPQPPRDPASPQPHRPAQSSHEPDRAPHAADPVRPNEKGGPLPDRPSRNST